MREIVEQKIDEYKSLPADFPELRKWLKNSDLWCWLYSIMKLTGRPMSKHQILSVLKGELDENLPLDSYEFLHNSAAVYKDMCEYAQLNYSVDMKLLSRWYCMALGEEVCCFRRNTPVVYQWGIVPVHFNEVAPAVDAVLRKYAPIRPSVSIIDRAVGFMCDFLRIYPFGEDSIIMAGFIVMYELIRAGIPVPSLTAGEQEFNTLVGDYLAHDDITPLTEMFERSLLNRLDAVITVCRQAAEVN